ncbi:carbohydrate esterase family 3 protein [Periconia macrospinosa]|uniref:Carbohydrate esterase family 3 protein n=1 Tax=Periconia macrospinosa TaxID=97972 RepID=A0A2V1E2W5_9PLEO|nr:carbohydrate esterase family 3 protein [Periconia macrospinosa]
MKFTILAPLCGLLSLTAALPSQQRSVNNAVSPRADKIRIMPMGASIVETTCWRAYLWQKLQNAGITNIDFVGGQSGPATCTLNGAPVSFDPNNEGHSGARATEYAAGGNLTRWLNAQKPVDIIMIHLGTNDMASHYSVSDTIKAYDTLLSEMRASNPAMKIIVSLLIPIDPKLFGQDVTDGIIALNAALRDWIARNKVLLVDNYTGFDYSTMTIEGEHPNEKGSVFMADHFYPVLKNAIEGGS